MAAPRIDVVDPSAESQALVEVLRGRGFEVVTRTMASLDDGCDAALLLLAGDADGAMDALEALRTNEVKVLVILLGRPEDDEGAEVTSIRHFDADAYYARPVPVDRVVRKVETYLSPPETHLAPVSVTDRYQARDQYEDEDDAEVLPSPRLTDVEVSPPEEPDAEDPDLVTGPRGAGWSPRERTITLRDEATPDGPADGFFDDDFGADDLSEASEVTGVTFKEDILSIEDAAAIHDSDEPVSQIARRDDPRRDSVRSTTESAAVLSPRLAKIFSEADRRIFPDSPALDLDLPDHQESARELVPDALLEVVSLPTEAREEDPLEAFTYVGVPPEHTDAPLPMPEAAQRYQRNEQPGDDAPSPPRPARTEAGTLGDSFGPGRTETDDFREPSRPARTYLQPEPTQRGAVAPSDPQARTGEQTHDHLVEDELDQVGVASEEEVLRILFSVAAANAPVDARFERPDGSVVELSVAGGRLTRISGRIHARAVEELSRQGRIDEVPVEEGRASVVIDERVAAGVLGRFEADRLLRRVRETEIHDLMAEATFSYDVTAASALRGGDPGLLAMPLAVVIAEGARRRISASRFRQLMGGGALVIDVRPGFGASAARLGLEPEVAHIVERHDEADLDELLGAAPAEEGLAGVLYALWAVGAVGVSAGAANRTAPRDPADALQAIIEAAYALSEDGSYFDVLGVSPNAMLRELRAAYVDRRRELRQIDLDAHALTRLGPERRDALEVVEEAWEVLRDDGV
ncbi:MAG: hypothetical protein JRH11_16770, partial [Deltaproteobacteria bacterium]|nr:hypothetical protein [Deltaproteobacteria bacterium]